MVKEMSKDKLQKVVNYFLEARNISIASFLHALSSLLF
jgi:hypothetical protein